MSRFSLHDLTDSEFQDLVVLICRRLLGPSITSFAPGPDGGKDAKFEGTATCFPSEAAPATGKFIIQAKHTRHPYASCSDREFERKIIEREEVPRIKRQVDQGRLTHYLLFTNRRKTGGAEDRIPDLIRKKCGLEHVWLRGSEDIELELLANPQLVKQSGLEQLRSPIQFLPDDIRDVILTFHRHRPAIPTSFDGQYDYRNHPTLPAKNLRNGLTEIYYREMILGVSEPLFATIRRFLLNPRNSELAEKYHAVADELKAQLILHRDHFQTFDEALEHICHLMHERAPELQSAPRRRLTRVFVHYMYVNCDVGEKG